MRVLDLNDAGVRLSDGERLIAESPGYAAIDGRQLQVGEAARARLRLDPRRSNDRFWYQLDAPLASTMGQARNAADLAYAHLQSFGADLLAAPLLIAAPASFTPAQLGVLLGLLQSLGARVVGLVDSAVAAASAAQTHAQVVHVDVQLHRFVFTLLGGSVELERQRVEEHKPGLATIQDRCLAVFADAFVRQTRFDPMHSAATEQLLFDRLPTWFAQLQRSANLVLELEVAGRVHRASVTAEALAGVLAGRHRALADSLGRITRAQPTTVLLSDRAAAVPGLAQALAPLLVLETHAVASGALRHATRVVTDDAELPWVTRLPRLALAAAAATVDTARPTHVLMGSRAQPLPAAGQTVALSSWLPGAPGLVRQAAGDLRIENAQGGVVQINGVAVQPEQRLQLGDVLVANGIELRLIEVGAR